MKILLIISILASTLHAEIEYLFASPVIPSGTETTMPFIIRESDKTKVPELYWRIKDSDGFVGLHRWMRREGRIEPIQIKMLAAELYSTSDHAMMREILIKLKEEEK